MLQYQTYVKEVSNLILHKGQHYYNCSSRNLPEVLPIDLRRPGTEEVVLHFVAY